MTKNTRPVTAKNQRAKEPAQEAVVTETPVVGANPAHIPWPSDKWGLTKDFRAAVAALGQRTGGMADKRALVVAHVEIALLYLEAKFLAEESALAARLEKYTRAQEGLEAPTTETPVEGQQLDLFE